MTLKSTLWLPILAVWVLLAWVSQVGVGPASGGAENGPPGPDYERPLVNIAGPAYGTQVRADTQYSEKHAGTNAVDGRLDPGDGCWYSRDWTALPCALTFELAQEEDLRRVVLIQAAWTGNMYHTQDFALETSADGETWTRVATGQLPDESLARAEVDVAVRTRWLRVVVLTSYNPQQTCGLAEVELLAAGHPGFGPPEIRLNHQPAPPPSGSICGLSFVAAETGPQIAVFSPTSALLACVHPGEEVAVLVPVFAVSEPFTVCAEAALTEGEGAEVGIGLGDAMSQRRSLTPGLGTVALEVPCEAPSPIANCELRIAICNSSGREAAVRWSHLRLEAGGRTFHLPLAVTPPAPGPGPPPVFPPLRPPLQRALIEWDWKLQDGIGTERNPSTYPAAVEQIFERGQRLIDDLCGQGLRDRLGDRIAQWETLKREREDLVARGVSDEATWEGLYLRLHWLRREIALRNPLADVGPLLFVKQVPGCFSHQLTQYYGRYARPGGGVFVLDAPGVSMECRQVAPDALPMGSFMQPEVSYEGDRILFSYCAVEATPQDPIQGQPGRYFHLYEIGLEGGDGRGREGTDGLGVRSLRQLTDGPYNDFAPRYLPDGRILFVSTRRGGWHRCGNPGCETYTLTVANADGSDPHPISFHETQEWDPAVLADGRIIYTRWDYVDRHPVFYEHLWTVRPDGTGPAAFFGNNTFNPIGLWEAQPVPNSPRVMATAAAHHAMTAGSIVLVDVRSGVDGPPPIVRLTPDAPFPESETPVAGRWFYPQPGTNPFETPESQRWPGHCYRSPYPLSETYFLAAYSFLGLIGEPSGNPPNMFGLYLVDAFGNKELLYRDPNIASLWPVPLRPRPRPPVLPSQLDPELGHEGVFLLQDVYASDPPMPRGSVKALRIVQIVPKSTPGIDNPPVGRPRGAPGKQVLGTVPVEPDGSAYFRAPAGVEIAFQALDARGLAVQVMRSGTYLQPGERVTCVGCHEPRTTAPAPFRISDFGFQISEPHRPSGHSTTGLRNRGNPARLPDFPVSQFPNFPLALRRPPSRIMPGPDGSKPFSYPLLVQPVLDRHCVSCHAGPEPAGGLSLTGEPEGHYTVSYNVLVERVPFSDQGNAEPLSQPGRFGARGSPVMALLLAGHHDVQLPPEDLERLATWMDTNALFYGTFDPADQARQQRGERIEGPKLE